MDVALTFTFSSQVVEPPTGNQVRLNTAGVDASLMWVRPLTTDGIDAYYFLLAIPIGARVVLQDKNDHTRGLAFVTTGPAVDRGTYFEIPIGSGEIGSLGGPINSQTVLLVIAEQPGSIPIPGPKLVAFETAKTHLRITDDDHDVEIQTKIDHASAIMLDYLKSRGDPTWDATSCPLPVQAATLYMIGLLYEHRGDDLEAGAGDFDQGTWDAIERLLKRSRDPALA